MTYAEGDPGHIDVHESIRLLFMAAGLDPSLIPDEATLGATTHIDDHNKIADALAWLDANGIPGPGPATVSGTTGSPTTGTGLDGKSLRTWTGNGSFTLSTGGLVRLLVVCGGGAASASVVNGGAGGAFDDVMVVLPAGTYAVTVGAGGVYAGGNGGVSQVKLAGGFVLSSRNDGAYNLGNGSRSPDATGRYSDISGTSVGYAGAGYNSTNSGTYNSAYGGGGNGAGLAPRANSGGGGCTVNTTGNGAAGIVQLLV